MPLNIMKRTSPVGGGQEQQSVHQGDVVADEERAAFGGDILAAIDADAINRMRGTHNTNRSNESGSSQTT